MIFSFTNHSTSFLKRFYNGFTLIELVVIIVLVVILVVIAIPRYSFIYKDAEHAAFDYSLVNLQTALDMYSMYQIINGQPIVPHNPFDDMRIMSNYVGAFADVNDTNCPPGSWAFQTGDPQNSSWIVIVYRPINTLAQAFTWNGMQWIVYIEDVVLNSSGRAVGLKLTEYPPPHVW